MSSLHRLRGKEVGIVCRLCSSNNGIMVLNIFDSEGQKRRVLSLIKDCLPVQVSETDALPKVICHNCLHKLESFHEFQTNCLKSEATLMSSVSYSASRSSLQEFNNIPHPPEQTTEADFTAELVPLDRLTQLIHPAPLLDQAPVHHEHQRENSLEMMVKQEIEETKSPENEEDAEWDKSYIEEDLSLETGHDSDTTEQFECVEMKTEKNSSVEASVTSEMHTDQTLDDMKRARHKRDVIKEARLSGNKYVNYKGKEIPAKSCGEPCGGSNQTEEERGDSLPVRWKKKMDKLARYAPKKTPIFPTCGHHSCSSLAMKDILEFHASFYATRIKAEQDSFLLRFCRLERREKTGKFKLNTRKCFVKAVDGQMVPVCYKTFFGILGVTKHRIAYVLNKYSGTGEVPRENRGGDRRSRKRLVSKESCSKQ